MYIARKQRFAVKVVYNNCDLGFWKLKNPATALTVMSADLKLACKTQGFRWELEEWLKQEVDEDGKEVINLAD